ncbi:hypothetical protein M2323_004040 [Rhodoblastus acidophilus]|uniref:hypothetical protein n=1 Tax=Rhodoblastus acidophilus TaxID=1074 RepID=UPI00222542E2|nr:hypothetical protein [Rhodoblastus acidophilus]MCW2286221.1 hypothetical protein [Rhodoblastus acidophilus]MCW2335096.1 hypothetical protein [Rhodoblastus acidophilus]
MKTIIGIDPGVNGAVSVLDEAGSLLNLHDLPVTSDGFKGRSTINCPLLAALIRKTGADRAFCELIGPRPTDGVAGAFGFGRSRGAIEGVLAACGVSVVMIAPPVWKRHAGVPAGKEHKDVARARAIARWPAQAELFARKSDIDRAEACLIALAGMAKEVR